MANDSYCYNNQGSIGAFPTGGVQPYNYTLNNGIPQANNSFTNLAAGIYTLHVSDATLCSDSVVLNINYILSPQIDSVTTSGALCNNGTICLYVSGGNPGYTFSINPGNVNIAANCFTNVAAGIYTVSVADANGCFDYTTAFVNLIPNNIVLNATPSAGLCNCSGSVALNATGGISPYTYTIWGGINPNAVNICNGNYTAQVTDSAGCQATTNFTIASINSPIYISTSVTNANCGMCNGTITANATGGGGPTYTYDLDSAGVIIQTNNTGIFTSVCGSTYAITATDNAGCTTSVNVNVQIISPMTLNTVVTNTACVGVANGSIVVNVTGGTFPYQYSKDNGANYQASNTFGNLLLGLYPIKVLDAAGCVKTAMVSVQANTPINIVQISNLPDTCFQHNGSIELFANGAVAPSIYSMNGFPNNANGQFLNLSANNYTATVSDALGCIATTTFTISNTLTSLPTISVNPLITPVSCTGTNNGSIQINVSGGNPPFLYNWGNYNNNYPNIGPVAAGNYDLIITDATGNCQLYNYVVPVNGANCGAISGKVYLDANVDCMFNAGETPIKNSFINLGNNYYGYTNMNGEYVINNLPFNTYFISQTPPAYIFENSCVQPNTFTLNLGNPVFNNLYFADSSYAQCDAQAWITGTATSPGFTGTYTFSVINNSPANSCLTNAYFIKPANISFGNINPSPTNINQDTVFWNNIGVGGYSSTDLNIGYYVPANVPLGNIQNACAHVDVIGTDVNPLNNDYCYQNIVTGAFDPNNKSVSPVGEGANGNILLQDSLLNYRINFQNTGTDSAVNVFVMDTLSNKLDLATLKIMGSSHLYTVEIIGNNVIKFNFVNIMLPDSNINEPLSHGYIAYSIEQKNTNQIGDVINNTAHIYFDFNAPVVTNTTVNTIAYPALLSSPEFEKTIMVYPNPATDNLTIEFNSNSVEQSSVSMINTLGQVMKTVLAKTINGKNKIEISVNDLPKGLYLLKLSNGKNQSMRKVVIE